MNIAVIGRGNAGGGLARRWERAGHTVTKMGRDQAYESLAHEVKARSSSAAWSRPALEEYVLGLWSAVRRGLGPFFYRYARPGEL